MLVKQMLPRAHERLAVIEAEAPVREAAYLMSKPHTDLVVVCSRGDMVGVVTKTDIVNQISRCTGFGCTTRVESVMTRDVTYCRANELLRDVWSVMKERGLQRIPVLDGARRPIGVIYARDALQNLLGEAENEDELLRDYIAGVGYW
jgi:CBS domain-containing protein